MKINNKLLKSIVYFTLVMLAFSCEKPPEPEPVPQDPVMPALTNTGANTFGCYIDDELFVANEGPSVWSIPAISGSFDEESRYLVVQGTRYSGNGAAEEVVSDDIRFRATINDNTSSYSYEIFEGGILGYSNLGGGRCDYYYETKPDIGAVTITHLDEVKNVISGTFNIKLYNDECDQNTFMTITEGRFDFRY
ncbi:MAG: hypothetical protein ACI8ZM_002898 [Crocinitomix sp.]|jgi:hypothetical protein